MELTHKDLKDLQLKLKVGNRNSIYLNATIKGQSKNRFDLHHLSRINSSYPERFLVKLLSESNFSFPIDLDKSTSPFAPSERKKYANRFNGLIRLLKDVELDKGVNSFGFGYPLIVRKTSDNKTVVAPLLIWTLRIRKDKNRWLIEKTEVDAIYLNEVFINHTESDLGFELDKILSDTFDSRFIDKEDVVKICCDILKQLRNENEEPELLNTLTAKVGSCQSVPKNYEDSSLPKEVGFHWSGLFSIFETQNQSIVNEYEYLITSKVRTISGGKFNAPNFQTLSSIETDPTQQKILNALKSKKSLIIHGPPGTGKSQTLTAIIVNALENKKKVLVVCEKSTALDVLNEQLTKQGLESLFVQIMDSKKDRLKIVKKVLSSLNSNEVHSFNSSVFNNLDFRVRRAKELINQINICHQNIHQPLEGGNNWTGTVGTFLQHRNEKDIRPIELEFDSRILEFTHHELEEINDQLKKAEGLFFAAKPYLSSNPIKPSKFLEITKYKMAVDLRNDVHHYKKSIVKLQKLYNIFVEDTRNFLAQKYDDDFAFINKSLFSIHETFKKYVDDERFMSPQKRKTLFSQFVEFYFENKEIPDEAQRKNKNILSQFSIAYFEKNKNRIQDRKQCIEEYNNTLLRIRSIGGFNLLPVASNSPATIPFEEIDAAMREWVGRKDEYIEKTLKRIESIEFPKMFPSYSDVQQEFGFLKARITSIDDWFVDELLDFSSVPNLINSLQLLISDLTKLLDNNDNAFGKLYDYQSFIGGLKEKEVTIIEALKSRENWTSVFSFYYLDRVLVRNSDSGKVINEELYENLIHELEEIKETQSEAILSCWLSERQKEIQQNEIAKLRLLFMERGGSVNPKKSLRQIIQLALPLFQSFFPVVLTNPVTCSTLFGGHKNQEPFDFVIFDEASQLRVKETLPALLKGKQKIISGDEHQMPPSDLFTKRLETDEGEIGGANLTVVRDKVDTVSLLELAQFLAFENCPLEFHYRSQHEYLIDFSNAAFYENQLCPIPRNREYVPIEFYEVNGTYKNKKKEGINVEEADNIIAFLKNIQPDSEGELPSVGIATFNQKQKKLIDKKINEASNDKDFKDNYIQLDKKGLFVNNLINIQGFERDAILISTTFGENEDENFGQRFGQLNEEKGYKLLNVIVTRAKERLVIFTSIPESIFQNYQNELKIHGNNRKGILYAYLTYARAVSQGNDMLRKKVLNDLSKNSHISKSDLMESKKKLPFQEEVYKMLLNEFPPEVVKLKHSYGGFKVDIAILSNNINTFSIAIECDGAKERLGEVAYLHDLHRKKILKKQGVLLYRIWSERWWRDWKTEFRLLMEFIEENVNKNKEIVGDLSLLPKSNSLREDGIVSRSTGKFTKSIVIEF